MNVVRKLWSTWKHFGHFLGDIIARVVLTMFYFTLFAPFGLGVRFAGDPLMVKPKHRAKWIERTTHDRQLSDAQRLS